MANSSYLQYLPPVLWTPDKDPAQTLGRNLQIYEKILTGLSANGVVVRASAAITGASAAAVQLKSLLDVPLFQEGDWITIEGSAERRQIVGFAGNTMLLDASLLAAHPAGAVRIADLVPGQTAFRASSASQLEAGRQLQTLQSGLKENLWIASVSGDFLNLAFGLVNSYSMDLDAVPVKLIDPIAVLGNSQAIADFETRIDGLSKLFNPWRTPTEFLPYLASWVALEVRPEWSEYQTRKLIAGIVGIYQQRGQKAGIYTYLDIYAVSAAKPRIAVDDNDAVLHAVFSNDGTAVLRAVAHSTTVSPASAPAQTVTALLHPNGVAVDSKNNYFISDPGTFGYTVSIAVPRKPALWRTTAAGDIDFAIGGGMPMPMPAPISSGLPLVQPMAVVADAADQIAVIDTGSYSNASMQHSALYRFAPPSYALTTVINQASAPALPAVHPVDMVLDGAGHFVVLDRGFHPLGNPPAGASAPKIVVVSEGPLAVATHPLGAVQEPTALIMDPLGRFIVSDAKLQSTTNPADLVLVDPGAGWTTTSLLSGVAINPLIFPTGLVWESTSVLLVCDTGVRWGFVGDPSNRVMAEDARIYRVDLAQAPPVISLVTTQRQLVKPSRMGRDKNGRVLVIDAGEFPGDPGGRSWRAGANEFGAVVLFSNQRLTASDDRNAFRRGVIQVIDTQTPAHTSWWMDF